MMRIFTENIYIYYLCITEVKRTSGENNPFKSKPEFRVDKANSTQMSNKNIFRYIQVKKFNNTSSSCTRCLCQTDQP